MNTLTQKIQLKKEVIEFVEMNQFTLAENALKKLINLELSQPQRALGELPKLKPRLTPGAEITLNSKTRPMYMIGKKATIDKVNRSTVTVSFAKGMNTGRFGHTGVRIPLSLIEGY